MASLARKVTQQTLKPKQENASRKTRTNMSELPFLNYLRFEEFLRKLP